MKQQTIALYGHNLVLSIVGACLQQKPEFRIICIEGVPADYLKKMDAAYPQVVLFDLTLDTHFAALLAWDYPEIIPIGIDLTRHKIWLPSGKLLHLFTIEDLVTAISTEILSVQHAPASDEDSL